MKKEIEITNGSPERFGYEWVNYSEPKDDYEEQFRRWIPFLSKEDWVEKIFLDVGCGMGRNSYWPLSYGAKSGVGVDVDQGTLKSATQTLKNFKNMELKFCSAYDLNYQNDFDIVFSIGVIHHLEYPQVALKNMVQCTKVGGKVAIWVYGYENNEWIVKYFDPIRKKLFSILPIGIVHHLSIYPTIALYIYLRLFPQKIEYNKLISNFTFTHLRSIVFDQMLPKIAHYWKKSDVIKLLEDAGLSGIEIQSVNEMSWSAIGTKKDL